MKKLLPLVLIMMIFPALRAQEAYSVTADGYEFNPSDLNVFVGDTVIFNIGTIHTATQVSEATWNANGSTPLEGGFDITSGQGIFIPIETGIIYFICTPHISKGMKGKITVSETASVPPVNAKSDPEIYPNPAADVLYLNSPSSEAPSLVTIYDMTGKIRLKLEDPGMVNHVTAFSLQNLDQGVYFIRLNYPGKSYILKFIKL